jgi:hypothetical protein
VQAAMTACHAFEEDLRRYKLITPDVSITSRAC